MLIELSKILILWNLHFLSAGLSSVIHTPYQWIYSFLILWNRFRGKSDEKALGLQRSKRRVNCCLCDFLRKIREKFEKSLRLGIKLKDEDLVREVISLIEKENLSSEETKQIVEKLQNKKIKKMR